MDARLETSTAPPPGAMASAQGAAARANRWLTYRATKPLVFLCCCLPGFWLCWAAWHDLLGANPAEVLIRSLGDWSLRALVLVLLVTPMRVMAGWPALARLRRMLGLFVFFYASLHLLAYAWFDMGFVWHDVWADLVKRPFILVGFAGWVLLMLMAATSFNLAIRALGALRWRWLHRSVYAVAVLAVLHFFWMRSGKNDFAEVAVYACLLGALLGWRVWRRLSVGSRPVG